MSGHKKIHVNGHRYMQPVQTCYTRSSKRESSEGKQINTKHFVRERCTPDVVNALILKQEDAYFL